MSAIQIIDQPNVVSTWFGVGFHKLHPRLQKPQHLRGGKLHGIIDLTFGNGIAGMCGRRLAQKLDIQPIAGKHFWLKGNCLPRFFGG